MARCSSVCDVGQISLSQTTCQYRFVVNCLQLIQVEARLFGVNGVNCTKTMRNDDVFIILMHLNGGKWLIAMFDIGRQSVA
ncbi:MAG TPA: hypothetical protein PLD79_00120 [Halothiobacillus sp.]|nr:hypothetical protein [Halothiobacillus sp.]